MDIAAWLSGLGLDAYAARFAAHDIDAETLALLTADDLRDMGIQSIGHRRKLLAAIAELTAQQPAAPPPDLPLSLANERREVTVLFADIAGFTALSTTLDAEVVHALLAQFFERVDAIVADAGGRIDKHIGDCVMAVFGAPLAHADDMQRGVRAACQIHAAMTTLAEPTRQPLRAHVGLATGEVVASATGSAHFAEYTVTGETVNLASRLSALAAPGETIISEAVATALADEIDAEPAGVHAIKGFAERIGVWRLKGVRARAAGQRPLFGRRAELAQCLAALESARETGSGALILLRGEAGIGKSRLAEEVLQRAQDLGWQIGMQRVPELSAGTASDVLSGLGRHLLALLGGTGEPPMTALSAEQRLAIEDLTGVEPSDRHRLSAMTEAARAEARIEALQTLVGAGATHHPLLLVVEDIHWAPEAALLGLQGLATRVLPEHPVVVLMTTRLEGDPSRKASPLSGLRKLTIDLGPLSTGEARAHAASLLAGASELDRCVERAGGNPLFLEQLARHATSGRGGVALPSSIKSAVLARIDRLDGTDKQMLQAAAVLGDELPAEALRAIADRPSYDPAPLLDGQLLVRAGEAFRFTHALIREGVYGSILHSTRERLHQRAADWYAGRDLALHAEHLARAKSPAAIAAYLDAARQLARDYRTDLALDLVARAEAIVGSETDRHAVLFAKGDYLIELGRGLDAVAAYEGAFAAADVAAARARALIGKAGALRVVDRVPEALALLESAEVLIGPAEHPELIARLEHLRGNLLFPLGERARCEAAHARAYDHAVAAGAVELQARALGGLADAAYANGLYLTTTQRLEACVALARRHGLGRVEIANLPMLALAGSFSGGSGIDPLTVIDAAQATRQPRAELIAQHVAMVGHLWRGTPEGVAAHFERAQAIVAQIGAKRFEPENLVFMADALRQQGDWGQALTLVDRASRIIEEGGFVYFAAIVEGCRALIQHSDGVVREAALSRGEALVAKGGISHDPLFFAYYAIEAGLAAADGAAVERASNLLETAFAAEPSPFVTMLSRRGRLLAAAIETPALSSELSDKLARCGESVRDLGYGYFAASIEAALGSADRG